MKDKDSTPIEHPGLISQDGGPIEPVYLVHAEGEPCMDGGRYESGELEKWKGSDGRLRVRRVSASSSVGASRAYGAAYDGIDWGN